jgi:hypothetical protein
MTELKNVFSNIYENWGFGGSESRSGPGSSLEETETIRKEIRILVKERGIKTVVDIPCGDFNWMKEIVYGFEKYTGGDIVPAIIKDNQKYANQLINFIEFDLTGDEEIPEADLLIIRDVIGHLPLEKGKKIIENILKSKCKYLLSTTWYNLNDKDYYKMHDNAGVTPGRFYPVCLLSEPFNLPQPELYLEEIPVVEHYDTGVRKGLGFWDLDKIRQDLKHPSEQVDNNVTIVTGLWNMGRGELQNEFSRSYEDYKQKFANLLKTPANMFIYVAAEDEDFIWQHRSKKNTFVKVMELSEFDTWFEFFNKVQEIRQNPDWFNQADWLRNSPQAKLKYYNPVVMSKMFLLNNATLFNPFQTSNFFWIDAGITNTVHEGYFWNDNVFKNLPKLTNHLDRFILLSYPYENGSEIHGFERTSMAKYCGNDPKYVCRGGFFGGSKKLINLINSIYYSTLSTSLSEGYMGTEESIFTIITHLYPEITYRFILSGDGLVWPFFESLKNIDEYIPTITHQKPRSLKNIKTNIYVLGFNSPLQFKMVAESIKNADPEMFNFTRKILVNNSTDSSMFEEYDKLCEQYQFEEIHSENIGICGGRQFIAEHFDASDADFYMFFEDDMLVNDESFKDKLCKSGMTSYVENLYQHIVKIMLKDKIDFLKISFSEFYGDNGTQWSWYNVPQIIRTQIWPEYDKLPAFGLDPNAPRTKFDEINTIDEISYIKGQVYYSNWPMIVSKKGNYKMFLETKWTRPYEQTWMSHMFQETLKGNIKSAVLLASPINHNRIAHYTPEERREN